MSAARLSRASAHVRDAAPVRLVHLGLGNFFRAHQAWYTDRAADAEDWGIAAFTGRSAVVAEQLTAQDGLYTLVTRAADRDRFELVASLSRAHAAAEHDAWLACFAATNLAAITITVTETAGFSRTSGFVDDTRAFCSIPARHDMSRRVDAGVLARLVAEHRLDEDEAVETAIDLVVGRPAHVFKL